MRPEAVGRRTAKAGNCPRAAEKPQWIFADEATVALDELAENTLNGKLQAHVGAVGAVGAVGGGMVSIAHRPSVAALDSKQWVLEKLPEGAAARYELKKSALPPAGMA